MTDVDETEADFEAAADRAVVSDLSAFGRIEVHGTDRLDLLHRLSTNDLLRLKPGQVTSTVFVTDKGRIIDQVIVVVREPSLLLITSPGTDSTLIHWIGKYTITEDIRFTSITSLSSMLWLTGPRADSIVQGITGFTPLNNRCGTGSISGEDLGIIVRENSRSRAIYLVFDKAEPQRLMKNFESHAMEAGARTIGSTAYDTLRISRGIASHQRELSDEYNPYEAGLREDISFTKGCYIGQEVVARLDTYQKIRRKLVGLEFREGSPVMEQQPLLKSGKDVGMLTSVAPVPYRGKVLGLGIVSDAAPGDEVTAARSGNAGVVSEFPLGGA